MRATHITPQFVVTIPTPLQEGVLYISRKYSTAIHRCCCGCGTKIVTPLKPTDWTLTVTEAGLVTLHPSIGNWNHPCQSHYIIQSNRVIWAGKMSARQIKRGRDLTRVTKERYYKSNSDDAAHAWIVPTSTTAPPSAPMEVPCENSENLWTKFKRWLTTQ